MGSTSELEYLLLLTHDLGFVVKEEFGKIADEIIEIKKMLASFIQKLKTDAIR